MALTKVTSSMIKGQTLTYQIPTDFSSLQAAVNALSPTVNNDEITLNIETGHRLTSGLVVSDGNYTQFTITSTDAKVYLDPSWTAATSLLTGTNARMPNWNIFVDCEGKNVNTVGVGAGAINVLENSTLLLGDGAGCTNGGAGNNGLFVYRNSKATGSQNVFSNFPNNNVWITHVSDGYLERVNATGAGLYGAFVSRGSRLYAAGGDFSDATEYGVQSFRSRVVAIPFGSTSPSKFNNCGIAGANINTNSIFTATSRSGIRPQFYNSATHGITVAGASTVDVGGADFKDCAFDGIRVFNSRLSAKGCIFSNIGRDIIVARESSTVAADNISADNAAGRSAILADHGSTVFCNSSALSNAGGDTIHSSSGATVVVSLSTLNNSGGNALRATGGYIVAQGVTATGAALRGALAEQNGRINVTGANLSGASVAGIRAIEGSHIAANNCNAQAGGSPATIDCQIVTGSIIAFNGGTGGTNQTINTITGAGIIFG
jgi:hypothetical protein